MCIVLFYKVNSATNRYPGTRIWLVGRPPSLRRESPPKSLFQKKMRKPSCLKNKFWKRKRNQKFRKIIIKDQHSNNYNKLSSLKKDLETRKMILAYLLLLIRFSKTRKKKALMEYQQVYIYIWKDRRRKN